MKRRRTAMAACVAAGILAVTCGVDAAEDKLQIVFMFGQSEMVGQANVSTAVYMLQKPLVPPREATLNAHKAMPHQINGAYLYWQAMHSYGGPKGKKEQLKALIEERSRFKNEFKQHVREELAKNDGMFRGKHYARRSGFWLYNMCDEEAEKQGITPKIRAILDAPDNTFNVEAAYEQLLKDSQHRYQKQLELNRIYLNGTTPEDFSAFAEACKAFEADAKNGDLSPEEQREAYARLAAKHLHLPVASQTCVSGLGTIAGAAEGDAGHVTGGKLSVGYGAGVKSIGLEYAAGIALERALDSPVLIVKCAWNNGESIADFWRSSSQDAGKTASEQTKEPAWAWTRTLSHVKKVLADPGRYYPGYDRKAGYEVAGLIWFQGLGERDNPDYGQQLASLLGDFRKAVNAPDLPVVCATVGTMFFQGESDDHPVNRGMREVAKTPAFKGTLDVVETYKWFPSELSVIGSLLNKRRLNSGEMQATIQQATTTVGRYSPPYSGCASFYLLAGHEAGTRLAKMIQPRR